MLKYNLKRVVRSTRTIIRRKITSRQRRKKATVRIVDGKEKKISSSSICTRN